MAQVILRPPAWDASQARERGGRRRTAAHRQMIEVFTAMLQGVEPGWGGDVDLGDDEDKAEIRDLLKVAARDLGLHLTFRPQRGRRQLHFRVSAEAAATPRRDVQRPSEPQSSPGTGTASGKDMLLHYPRVVAALRAGSGIRATAQREQVAINTVRKVAAAMQQADESGSSGTMP